MVVCHPPPLTGHFQAQPVVIIEVLRDSTRRADLGEKCDAYLTLSPLKTGWQTIWSGSGWVFRYIPFRRWAKNFHDS
jgi:Uma2 family endonuclease